jgi:hypothetical protein
MLLRHLLLIATISFLASCGGGADSSGPDPLPDPTPDPKILILNYPTDFPATQTVSTLPPSFVVTGLSASTAYTFSLTGSSPDLKIMVQNYTQPSTPICVASIGSNTCTGTTGNSSVLVAFYL